MAGEDCDHAALESMVVASSMGKTPRMGRTARINAEGSLLRGAMLGIAREKIIEWQAVMILLESSMVNS